MKKFQKFAFWFISLTASVQLILLLSTYQSWGPRDKAWLTTIIAIVWAFLRYEKTFKKDKVPFGHDSDI